MTRRYFGYSDLSARAVDLERRLPFDVRAYGAVGDGNTDDTVAIRAAVSAALASLYGGIVYFPPGRWVTDEITVPASSGIEAGLTIVGAGKRTKLMAKAANQTILRISSDSNAVMNLCLSSGGLLGVRGLALVPADEAQITTIVDQSYNHIQNIRVEDCSKGVEIRCGPTVAGHDSGAWYNTFLQVEALNCQTGFLLNDGSGNGRSGVNRNQFFGCRAGVIGSAMAGYGNVGFDLRAAAECSFHGCSAEGITLGATPLATPTAVRIENLNLQGVENFSNKFFAFHVEACTQHLDNDNAKTVVVGCNFASPKCVGTVPFGGMNLSADVSAAPMIFPSFQYGEGIPGYSSTRGAWSKPQDVTGDVTATDGFSRTNAITAAIANLGTFDIVVPAPRQPQLLSIWTGANLNRQILYHVQGDGAAAINATPILSHANVGVAALSATTVRVTNNTGVQSPFRWALLPLGVAF